MREKEGERRRRQRELSLRRVPPCYFVLPVSADGRVLFFAPDWKTP